jgi:hypothetical protein
VLRIMRHSEERFSAAKNLLSRFPRHDRSDQPELILRESFL